MELNEALSRIDEIRRQTARSAVFRGYQSLPVGAVGLLAVLAAALQPQFVSAPVENPKSYLIYWLSVAVVGFGIMIVAVMRSHPQSAQTRDSSWQAMEQFLPSLAVGAVLTLVLFQFVPEASWMLPGLWSLVFSLGVFASCILLPKAAYAVGVYHLLAGALCLVFGQGDWALSPWLMGLTFGGGQLLGAIVLYFTLERNRAAKI